MNDSVFKVLKIFSFSPPEKRSLHLRAIEKGLFSTSIFRFHKTITFRRVLLLMILSSPTICPRRPGEGWEPSGGGFAPLHRPFGRPAFFVAGPRVTEVSLSGSTRRLNDSVFKVLEIFSFYSPEKRSLHLRAIEKGLFVASILRFHRKITFRYHLALLILSSPLFILDTPGRVGNLLAADLHRSIGLSCKNRTLSDTCTEF